MKVMQIYGRPVALDRNVHKDIGIIQNTGIRFAEACQTALIAAAEMDHAAKDFPVVFTKENDDYLPLAIFGLQQEQNLFVDAAGQWAGRYVPAFLRRYPFVPVLGPKEDDTMTVCIDETSPIVARGQGTPLFIDGKNSPLLDDAIRLLEDYKTQMDVTLALTRQLNEAGLLSEKTVQFKLNDGQALSLTGFATIDAEKLAQLSAETVNKLFQSGALQLTFLHLSSLGNWDRLIELHAKRSISTIQAAQVQQPVEYA